MDLKELITNEIKKELNGSKDVALLFSGGTDSLTCLYSLLSIGIRPKLYTFRLEDVEHKDVIVSRKVANYYNLNLNEVVIKKNVDQLIEDVIFLTTNMDLKLKTNVQCSYPFLHVLKEVKEKYVISGLCADDLYGTSKSMSIKCSNDKELFDTIRVKTFNNEFASAYNPIKYIVENLYGKKFIAPYKTKAVFDYFMKYSWKELNKPKQKQVAINAFNEEFKELKVYRRNVNLQVGSKIREWHNILLNTDLNVNKRKRVDEIYKDLNKGVVEL